MLDKLTNSLDFQTKALVLRAERQRQIAGNIANADTPGYAAHDFDFASALRSATGDAEGGLALSTAADASGGRTDPGHFMLVSSSDAGGATTGFAPQTQPAMDGNSVDLDRERAAFADNAVRYEATLRFINNDGKTMLSAIQGQ